MLLLCDLGHFPLTNLSDLNLPFSLPYLLSLQTYSLLTLWFALHSPHVPSLIFFSFSDLEFSLILVVLLKMDWPQDSSMTKDSTQDFQMPKHWNNFLHFTSIWSQSPLFPNSFCSLFSKSLISVFSLFPALVFSCNLFAFCLLVFLPMITENSLTEIRKCLHYG